jgi:hypothetical protein
MQYCAEQSFHMHISLAESTSTEDTYADFLEHSLQNTISDNCLMVEKIET